MANINEYDVKSETYSVRYDKLIQKMNFPKYLREYESRLRDSSFIPFPNKFIITIETSDHNAIAYHYLDMKHLQASDPFFVMHDIYYPSFYILMALIRATCGRINLPKVYSIQLPLKPLNVEQTDKKLDEIVPELSNLQIEQ